MVQGSHSPREVHGELFQSSLGGIEDHPIDAWVDLVLHVDRGGARRLFSPFLFKQLLRLHPLALHGASLVEIQALLDDIHFDEAVVPLFGILWTRAD